MLKRFEAFVSGITICYKHIQKIKSFEMTELGLKGTHAMCLFYLQRNPEGLTASQLCVLCEEDKAAISRTLNDLVEKGYIYTNNYEDKKKYRALMLLTDLGKEIADKVDQLIAQWVNIGGDGLSDEERNAFYYALDIIADNLKNNSVVNNKR